jgi:hypothetical protein
MQIYAIRQACCREFDLLATNKDRKLKKMGKNVMQTLKLKISQGIRTDLVGGEKLTNILRLSSMSAKVDLLEHLFQKIEIN